MTLTRFKQSISGHTTECKIQSMTAAARASIDRCMSRAAQIPPPRHWPKHVKSAVLHAVALGRAALIEIRAGFENSPLERARLLAKAERLKARVAMLEEELRIKDARMQRIPAAKRPQYPPAERLAILALRAASGWSAAETACKFLLTAATIVAWMRRLDERGPDALVQTPTPIHRFPDFVAVLVKSLKATLPTMGKVRIAQTLARAGLALAPSTAARLLRRKVPLPAPPPPAPRPRAGDVSPRRIFSRHPHHTWHADLSVVPTLGGFWVPWVPQALLPLWPFCFWVAVVLDHFSRAVVAQAVFAKQPSEADVCHFLDTAIRNARSAPRYLITGKGVQFGERYRVWCAQRRIKPRFWAVGKNGSIAVIERFFQTLKSERLQPILVPLCLSVLEVELATFAVWYNTCRVHQGLGGATPSDRLASSKVKSRLERGASLPLARGDPRSPDFRPLELRIRHFEGRAHLPIVELKTAA